MNEVTRMSNEDVRALVLRSAQEQDLHSFDLQVTRNVRVHSHTSHPATAHYHARSQDGSADYCIKFFDTSTEEKRMFFQREARLLDELSQTTLNHSVAMTPAVHLADEEAGILVMEWLSGFSMKLSLTVANYSADRRKRLLRLSAQWLRRFHEVSGVRRMPADASAMVERLQAAIDKMTDHRRNQLLSDKSVTRAIALLGERASAMDELLVEWSLYHRDFTPSNLIVSHNGSVVRGIDFGKASECAPVSLDLASFIARACDIGAGLLLTGTRGDYPRLSAIVETMLKEYKPELTDAERDWMLWCVLHWSVHRVVVYYSTGDSAASWNVLRRMNSHLKERKSRRLVKAICDLFQAQF